MELILFLRWLLAPERLLSLFVVLLIAAQYYYIILAGVTIPPSNWPYATKRFFDSVLYTCNCTLPPSSLDDDKVFAPNCTLDGPTASALFDVLGLIRMSAQERSRLFEWLDGDGDGLLRWPELTAAHVWLPRATMETLNGTVVEENDVGNPNNVTIWELDWVVEVWRRARDAKAILHILLFETVY
ncbi:hypothetical protein HK101_008469 [Irineochytrium annulatum]|nr:hypothetical protein HK101_008469 [Irineochytrium annulatum]